MRGEGGGERHQGRQGDVGPQHRPEETPDHEDIPHQYPAPATRACTSLV